MTGNVEHGFDGFGTFVVAVACEVAAVDVAAVVTCFVFAAYLVVGIDDELVEAAEVMPWWNGAEDFVAAVAYLRIELVVHEV